MKSLEIRNVLNKLPIQKEKIYLTTYEDDGYELGFGKAGKYKGHSHLHFYDIIYSPKGFMTKDSYQSDLEGNLLIVPPRTWMNDIELNDFFFIKFCNESGLINVPEKVDFFQNESKVSLLMHNESTCLPWFPSGTSNMKNIEFVLSNKSLIIVFNNNSKLIITY